MEIIFFSDERYAVVDYSHRNMVEVSELESSQGIPGLGEHSGFPAWLTLLQNHEHKTQEMLIYFNSDSDKSRWMEVVSPITSNVSNNFFVQMFQDNMTKAILVKIYFLSVFNEWGLPVLV